MSPILHSTVTTYMSPILWSHVPDTMVTCPRYYGHMSPILWAHVPDTMATCPRYYGHMSLMVTCPRYYGHMSPIIWLHVPYGVFTPEQDTDKTTARQMLNLCIPIMSFTAGPATTRQTCCERHHRNAQVQHLSCRCLALV